jgi:alkyl hydroperoxide reductase subunit AhpC
MIELGQLERHQDEFARRNTQVVVVSVEGTDDAQKTQTDFPHLLVLADQDHKLADAMGLVHVHAGPNGEDIAAPATILVDRQGTVRWFYRSGQVFTRLPPDELLQAIDTHIH